MSFLREAKGSSRSRKKEEELDEKIKHGNRKGSSRQRDKTQHGNKSRLDKKEEELDEKIKHGNIVTEISGDFASPLMNLSALQARPGLRAKATPLIKFFQSYSHSFSFHPAYQQCSELGMEKSPSLKSSAPNSKIRAFCSNKGKNGGFEESKKNKETDLYLYNTASRHKELFKPREPGKVGMYVCGVTAYDFSHIGHARVYVTFDILYR